ncbi:MAG: hypothetical protein ACO3O3_06985 [Ilumatobacteraceae bacterium]
MRVRPGVIVAVLCTATALTLGSHHSQAAELCDTPPVTANVMAVGDQPDRQAVWRDFVAGTHVTVSNHWNTNRQVKHYELSGGTITLRDVETVDWHMVAGSGIIKLPADGTLVGSIVAPDALVDFDRAYNRVDGIVIAKQVMFTSGNGSADVTGVVPSSSLICDNPINTQNTPTPEPSPTVTLARTGTSVTPAIVLSLLAMGCSLLLAQAARRAHHATVLEFTAFPHSRSRGYCRGSDRACCHTTHGPARRTIRT